MPEETEDYIRIRVSEGHKDHRTRTITISAEDGIKALYCGECKEMITYLFEKAEDWTMKTAKRWVKEHKKGKSFDLRSAHKAEDELSFQEIEQLIRAALNPPQPQSEQYVYLTQVRDNYVIYEMDNKVWKRAYEVNAEGKVVLGEAIEGEMVFQPLAQKSVDSADWAAFAADVKDDPIKDLTSIHRRFHMWAEQGLVPKGMTKADLAHAHNLVVAELKRRAKEEDPDKPYEHDSPLSAGDVKKSIDGDEALKCGAWNKLMAKLKKRLGLGKSAEANTAIKSLGNGRVGGYLMVWGNPTLKDLENTYFAPDTELCLDWFSQRPILYEHGQDGAVKLTPMGQFTTEDMKADEVGMWIEGQLDARKRYLAAVEKLIGMGVLNWSSRSLPDLMEIAPDGKITKWPLIEATMTTHPAELRFTDVQSMKAFFQEAGLELPQRLIAGAQGTAGAGASGQASGVELRRRRLTFLGSNLNITSKGD